MTTSTTTTSPAPPRRTVSSRRIGALARAEVTLLLRNRTTLFNAVLLAPATVGFLTLVGGLDAIAGAVPGGLGAAVISMLVAMALLIVVYYNLTTTIVARREELVLKRLLTGECSRTEILVATAVPALVILVGQLVLGVAAVAVAFELPSFTNPVLVLLALVGGTAVFALLAAASSGLTRTVESAQLTTLPVLIVTMVFSGGTLPLDLLPDGVQRVAELTPLNPVIELIRLGLTGTSADGETLTFTGTLAEAALPGAILAAWVLLSAFAASRWMRWEPRR
ncbi:ABC-2 type transporter [Beutenbergia cavernae DSM 12333]|uniref:ABC-2 type transporter n=1 Tax=Beutenbergia cavernae (strain ATCC BAA-8 / DSM 12333 / CCUG 43141 / JCM 11478 / NBRC 16432 / NCIMB 13614 / HKI 0122) TaxID=471853 RepID=C5C3E3_BEUC1|nr:ABC transporter permease [Beutenbergia cavernae]ACQ79842.1 ABC-2 type transporter [Beutenbergia cavernae DSM 12333]